MDVLLPCSGAAVFGWLLFVGMTAVLLAAWLIAKIK